MNNNNEQPTGPHYYHEPSNIFIQICGVIAFFIVLIIVFSAIFVAFSEHVL